VELKFDPKDPKYEYIQDLKALDKALEELEKCRAIGVDVEATGLDAFNDILLTVQIGSPEKSYIIDVRDIDLKSCPRYKELLENPKVIKILQNGKFDYKYLKYQTGADITNIYDTMLAEGVLTAGLGSGYFSLEDMAMRYCDVQLNKSVRKQFENVANIKTKRFNKEQLVYAALDTLVLFPILDEQLLKLKKENLVNIAKLEFAATKVVAEMEYRGIRIDVEKWRGIIEDLKKKRDVHATNFYDTIRDFYQSNRIDLFGAKVPPININSQVQIMDLFNNRLHLGIPSTGDAILAMVQHPVAAMLRDYRKYEKLISAFGESLLEKVNKKTGRLHPEFNQMGAATGRFSCENPNLQQIPRISEEVPFRQCFIPAPGFKLVTADYSSMEMRILADLSGDEKFIKALKDGLDVHSYTASLMFGLEFSKDFKNKYPDKRQAAKTINFGLVYGMGPRSLAAQIGVTPEEGKEYMDRYFQLYPSIRSFLNKMAKDAVRNGWSQTPAGRKRWYKLPDPDDPDYKKKIGSIERQAKNHPIQGTNADATKYALVFLHDRVKKEGVEGGLTHTVHDEIVMEIRNDQAEDWSKIQCEEMCRAAELFLKKVPVAADVFIGDVWEH